MANNDLKESQESERVIEKSPEKDADMTSIIFDAMIKSPESVTLGNIREKIPTNVSRKRIENWICYLKRTGENTGLFSIDLKIKKSKNKNTKTKDEYEDYYDCDNSNNKKTKYIFYESCISKTEIHGADNSASNYRHHGKITEKWYNSRIKGKKQHKNM